jgi:hypothetical protein
MAQPLFMEVTDAKSGSKVLCGLAHISVIVPGDDDNAGAFIKMGEFRFQTVETYDQIRRTLGTDMGGVRWGGTPIR